MTADLRTLIQSTYFGGSRTEQVEAVAIDLASSDILITGYTQSADLPGTGSGAVPNLSAGTHAFVARISSDLKSLRHASYFGGSEIEVATAPGDQSDDRGYLP